jgi:hypothetical protein
MLSQPPYEYIFLCLALLATLAIVLRNRCVLNDSVNVLCDEQDALGEGVTTLQEHLDALEKRVSQAELILDAVRDVIDDHQVMVESNTEDIAFACEIASTTYVQCHKPHITYMDEQTMKCLETSSATARQILNYLTENKSLINTRFFASGGELTCYTVNMCLYHLLQQGRVTKNDASPPVWSIK